MIGSKVARRYAKALFSLGQEDGKFEEYGRHLLEFEEFCTTNGEFLQVVSNQIFSVEDRQKILAFPLEKSAFPTIIKNFLNLLLEKNRIGQIGEINRYYMKLTDEVSNVTRAEIISAKPIRDKALEDLKEALRKYTSQEIKTEVKEDPTLIGGVVVKIGDLVLDGSVKSQLEGLRESLKRGEYN